MEDAMKQNKYDSFLVTVDAVILVQCESGLHVLTITRNKPPFKGLYAFPGGHVEQGETLITACARELFEETNVRIKPKQLQLLTTLDELNHDPRPGRRIGLMYWSNELPAYYIESALKIQRETQKVTITPIEKLTSGNMAFNHYKAIELLRASGYIY